MMRLEYDTNVDAAYIYLVYPLRKGQAKKTKELNNNIILDFDAKGRLLGVEILHASKVLDKKVLLDAEVQ